MRDSAICGVFSEVHRVRTVGLNVGHPFRPGEGGRDHRCRCGVKTIGELVRKSRIVYVLLRIEWDTLHLILSRH